MLLAHHHPEDAERCVRAGPLHLCRRCTAMWPLAFAVMGLGLLGPLPPASDIELLLLLGPPVGEYLATHAGRARYSAARTWIFGAMAGLAAGRLFHRYLLDPSDRAVWLFFFMAGVPALLAAMMATYARKDAD